jgi:hypothetical protein
MNANFMGGFLEGFSNARVADHLELKQTRAVAQWRAGERWPQRRFWPELAELKPGRIADTVKEIERAYNEWRNNGRRMAGGGGDGCVNNRATQTDDSRGGSDGGPSGA